MGGLLEGKEMETTLNNGGSGSSCFGSKQGVLQDFTQQSVSLCDSESTTKRGIVICKRGFTSDGSKSRDSTSNEQCSVSGTENGGPDLCGEELKTDLGVSSNSSNPDSDGKDLMIVASQGKNGDSVHMGSEVMLRGSGENFQELCMKVQILEEDNMVLMKELFAMVQERGELMSEVSEMLQIILQQHQRNSITGEESLEGSTRNGLLYVLKADSSPFLVTRVLKANTLSFQGPDSLMSK